MIQVRFKNLSESVPAKELAEERLTEALERFPAARIRIAVVTLEMENSPQKTGADSYKVRLEIIGGRYHGVILEKTADDLYKGLAYVCDGLLERLNRFSDRLRTKALKQRRHFTAHQRRAQLSRAQGE